MYHTVHQNQADVELLKKELKDIRSKLETRKVLPFQLMLSYFEYTIIILLQLEIEGWERLCQAKDKLLEERNAEKKQMMEQIKQKLEELNIDPNLMQVRTVMS